MTATTAQVQSAIEAVGVTGLTVYSDGVPPTATVPYVALWTTPATPGTRAVSGRSRQSSAMWQAVVVQNTVSGAALIAAALMSAIDGHRIGGVLTYTPFASSPLKDTTDPDGELWTVTVDITQQGAR
ncbi:hypothetical protein GCM10009785_34820 [Brooklawnia cerclae]|uniref:DUF3168 domain-containing protein n=1 Tax=Brooklawnia cerclae TaxID=349934 RepID=A0ABX0SKE1_9ACTN|nr:hypothetical protein [Brooklawnia cerclae]NIH58471.1 hypothetical protein [Brooklawnia cerclae]